MGIEKPENIFTSWIYLIIQSPVHSGSGDESADMNRFPYPASSIPKLFLPTLCQEKIFIGKYSAASTLKNWLKPKKFYKNRLFFIDK